MYSIKAFGAASTTAPIAPMTINRRTLTPSDVKIEIDYCGICHSGLHYASNEWAHVMPTIYPCVPGHEIIGRVVEVGGAVSRFKVGDVVGVGCLVDSDRTCPNCLEGLEQYYPGFTLTYGTPDLHGTAPGTFGGYSESIGVDEPFVLRIPGHLDLAAAPLLCAGSSPTRR